MNLDADDFRLLNAGLAFLIVFIVSMGLVIGWHRFGIWKWFTVSVLFEHGVLAWANLDAARDPAMPSTGYLPLRVMLLAGANLLVLVVATLATVATIHGDDVHRR